MPLEAQTKGLLDQIASMHMPDFCDMSVAQAREALMAMRELAGPVEEVAHIENRTIPGPGGDIPVRIYRPQSAGPLPVLLYFHGGGFVLGNLETTDGPIRALTNRTGCLTVSVDYRLAPEHKFPAAPEDCYAATEWVAKNAASIGGDPDRIAVGGDSAGGNLAAVIPQMARDRGGPRIAFQLLMYPGTNYDYTTASYTEFGENHLLTKNSMVWFWEHYLANPEDGKNPYASPLRATNLRGLPPALVCTCECDVLRDEGEAYASALQGAGAAVQSKRYAGTIHAIFQMAGALDVGKLFIDDCAAALRQAFAR